MQVGERDVLHAGFVGTPDGGAGEADDTVRACRVSIIHAKPDPLENRAEKARWRKRGGAVGDSPRHRGAGSRPGYAICANLGLPRGRQGAFWPGPFRAGVWKLRATRVEQANGREDFRRARRATRRLCPVENPRRAAKGRATVSPSAGSRRARREHCPPRRTGSAADSADRQARVPTLFRSANACLSRSRKVSSPLRIQARGS